MGGDMGNVGGRQRGSGDTDGAEGGDVGPCQPRKGGSTVSGPSFRVYMRFVGRSSTSCIIRAVPSLLMRRPDDVGRVVLQRSEQPWGFEQNLVSLIAPSTFSGILVSAGRCLSKLNVEFTEPAICTGVSAKRIGDSLVTCGMPAEVHSVSLLRLPPPLSCPRQRITLIH